ncbi:hypothetical protein FRC07_000157 [Ceratobasidium sp. 392]|nr:hypothetical protein FRC07_000157 [Ceratobasidium sp. 392]
MFFLFAFSLGNPNPDPSPAAPDVPAIAARAEPDSVDIVPGAGRLSVVVVETTTPATLVARAVDIEAAASATGTAGTTGRQINLAAALMGWTAAPSRLATTW